MPTRFRGVFPGMRRVPRRNSFTMLAELLSATPEPPPDPGPGRSPEGQAYLMRMSFLTDFTPPTARATSTALFAAAWELTKPLS